MNSSKTLTSILAATVLIAGLAACQKKEDVAIDKGPAETAGQKIDEATTKVGQEADKAKAEASQSAANMQDATGKKLEETGQKMQDSAKDK